MVKIKYLAVLDFINAIVEEVAIMQRVMLFLPFLLIPLGAYPDIIPLATSQETKVVGVDSATGEWKWKAKLKTEANWAQRVSGGVLAGCDGGYVVLLDLENGKVIWEARSPHQKDITAFEGEYSEGYLVGNQSENHWMFGKDGKILWFVNMK